MNDKKEFILPSMDFEADVQTGLDILEMQMMAEKKYKHLKPDKDELFEIDEKGEKTLTKEHIVYLNFVKLKRDLDMALYILKQIDSNVTIKQVSKWGIDNIRKLLFDTGFYQKPKKKEGKDGDFQKGEKPPSKD